MKDLLLQFEALKRALGVVAGQACPGDVAEAALACMDALIEAGEAECALELTDIAFETNRVSDPHWAARVSLRRIRSLFVSERFAESLAASRGWLELQQNAPFELLAGARIYEGAALSRLERQKEGIAILEGVRLELLRGPDTAELACCLTHLSAGLLAQGTREAARRVALEGLVSARRVGSAYFAGICQLTIAFIDRQQCRWHETARNAEEAADLFRAAGNAYQLNHAMRSLGLADLRRGRLNAAVAASETCSLDARQRGAGAQLAFALQLGAIAEIQRGQFEHAASLLSTCRSVGLERGGALRPQILLQEFQGDVLLESGHPTEALPLYDEALGQATAVAPRGDIVAELRRRRAECFLLTGKFERAHHEALEAIAHCQEISDRYEESATYRILGLACAALGRHDEAREAFDKGFSCYEDIETPYEWGKLWMSYGDWICGDHAGAYRDLNGAHEAYRSAANYFENIGAEYKLRIARERLAALEVVMRTEGAHPLPADTTKPKPLRRPREIADLHRRGSWVYEQFGIVTRNKALIDMLEDVARVAASELPVLILGESGTGKELVAQGVHKLSGRRGRFVPVNAGALPETMVEGELFGHVQGAFTNAVREKEGLFEYSHGGTIFLDEIGEMTVDLQAKLLRVLELGEIRRVGGTSSVRIDARVVAATNRDRLQMEAGQGFRSDLYYRLSHAMFELPPLRQRADDVEFLVEHFLDQFCARYRKRVTISPEAMERLVRNPWPGNVRQLRATMERLIVSARSVHTLMPRDVPSPMLEAPGTRPGSLGEELLQKERQAILDALERAQWVKADAARMLRMSRTTLLTKMKRLGIQG